MFAIHLAKSCEPEDKSRTYTEALERQNTAPKLLMNGRCDLTHLQLYELN